MSVRTSKRRADLGNDATILWWLDEPIRRGRAFNPKLAWFINRLPGRARTLLLTAALGELRDHDRGVSRQLLPVRTLREFIALPVLTLLLQNRYGYNTHMDLCRAFRANGLVGQLFGIDEHRLMRSYPYLR